MWYNLCNYTDVTMKSAMLHVLLSRFSGNFHRHIREWVFGSMCSIYEDKIMDMHYQLNMKFNVCVHCVIWSSTYSLTLPTKSGDLCHMIQKFIGVWFTRRSSCEESTMDVLLITKPSKRWDQKNVDYKCQLKWFPSPYLLPILINLCVLLSINDESWFFYFFFQLEKTKKQKVTVGDPPTLCNPLISAQTSWWLWKGYWPIMWNTCTSWSGNILRKIWLRCC
jgi:hypothetical protein